MLFFAVFLPTTASCNSDSVSDTPSHLAKATIRLSASSFGSSEDSSRLVLLAELLFLPAVFELVLKYSLAEVTLRLVDGHSIVSQVEA